jgi:ABC-type lipoprotein release transport system permease subunit
VLEQEGYLLLDHSSKPYFWKHGDVANQDWTGQKLDLTIWRDEVSFLTWILEALDAISLALITILLTIIVIGIMNAMMMATRERTQEIGTLRAIGMSKTRVLLMILLEALLLGLIATSTGALIGAASAIAIDAAQITVPSDALRDILLTDIITLRVRIGDVAASVVSLTLFTVLASAWPAARAARLQPVTAMHEVD